MTLLDGFWICTRSNGYNNTDGFVDELARTRYDGTSIARSSGVRGAILRYGLQDAGGVLTRA